MSLKDIARLSGTSIATVSRVLNGSDYHCKDAGLEERIWETARRLHYIPNTAAQYLKRGKAEAKPSFQIDLFLARDFKIDYDPFFKELYEVIREELLMQNCHIGRLFSIPELTGELYQDPSVVSRRQNADGLILLGKSNDHLLSYLKNVYPAIVGVDRNPTDFAYDEVYCNGVNAAAMAMNYLISLGHRHIAYIGDCSYEARYIGYYQTLMMHKIPLDYSMVFPAHQTREAGYQTMLQILEKKWERGVQPTAFFCANDSTALGVLDAIRAKRLKHDIPAVISIDNIKESAESNPMLTTIAIPTREMGHHAVSILMDRLRGHHEENIRIELPCHLVIRESCNE